MGKLSDELSSFKSTISTRDETINSLQMEKEELLKEKVNALNTSEGVKEQIGQLHKDKELLETEKRSLVDEKKDLEEKYSKVTDELTSSKSTILTRDETINSLQMEKEELLKEKVN